MDDHDPARMPSAPPDVVAAEGTAPARQRLRWVPIRALSARHRPRMLEHLLALPAPDRYLRFGSAATDGQIAHYVDLIDFDTDEVFGIFNRRLEVLAVAHLAFGPAARAAGVLPTREMPPAEFGVSVLPHARGRGYGLHLFERAVLHARNRGVQRMVIHALSENKAMLAIARKAGATVEREGSESQAELLLPPDDVGSHVEQLVENAAGEIDFRLKANAKMISRWLGPRSAQTEGAQPDEAQVGDAEQRANDPTRVGD